jgi:hypothetical protein
VIGRQDLSSQVTAARTAADAARKETMEQGITLADTIIKTFPDLAKAEATARTEAEEKAKKDQTDAAAARKTTIDFIANNAGYFVDRVAAAPADEMGATAQQLLTAQFGGALPPVTELVPLYTKFKPADTDAPAVKQAKTELLKALGLMPG